MTVIVLTPSSSSAINIPANAVQGVAGLVLGVSLIKIFERLKISFD